MKCWHVGIGALSLAGAAILLAEPSALAASGDVESARPVGFDPPAEPMVLTRTLRRPLPGGAEVMTRRSYLIQFRAYDSGYHIDGSLVDVEASVPAGFEKLAEFERQRRDPDLFPMRLDLAGRFVPKEDHADNPASGPVGSAALERLDRMNLPDREAQDAAEFITRISHHPIRTSWPEDLFNPAPGLRRKVQSVTLPSGEAGRVTIVIDARRDEKTGLLASFRREVTTTLGGSERITQETWTLAPKAHS